MSNSDKQKLKAFLQELNNFQVIIMFGEWTLGDLGKIRKKLIDSANFDPAIINEIINPAGKQ